jgi:hypothetical protein
MSERDGGPAFPLESPATEFSPGYASPGMTLRDYFAGQALPVCLGVQRGRNETCEAAALAAKIAYHIADAMLEARK